MATPFPGNEGIVTHMSYLYIHATLIGHFI